MKTVLKALKIGLVLLITSLALSSCVTEEEIRQQELKQQQEQLQKEEAKIHKKTVLLNQANGNLFALVSRNCINEEEFNQACEHVEKQVNRNFFGKWWFLPVILLYYLFIVIHAATTEVERYKPLEKKSIFFAWLIGGVFGVHIHKLREVPLSEYNDTKSSFFGRKWITASYLLLFFFFLSIYTPLTTFWTQPKVLFYWVYYYSWMNVNTIWRFVFYASLIMISVNVLTVICIPYWVYKYNALYFRHHYDNDKILSGQSTSIQTAIENCNSDVELSNQNRVIAMENLEKYNGLRAEDYDDSFMASCARGVSNVFTLGRAGKLRDKQDYLRLLQDSCIKLNTAVDHIENGQGCIRFALEQCRAAAYRNLYLTKEIIKYLKENYQDQEQELKIDINLQLDYSTNIVKDSKIANLDVSFDPTDLSESFSKNLDCSFSNLNYNLEKRGDATKEDFIIEGINLGLKMALNCITDLINYNENISRNLAEVEKLINKSIESIHSMNDAIDDYKAYILRSIEIIKSLEECNKAFVNAYEPICNAIFEKPTLKAFLSPKKYNERRKYIAKNLQEDIYYLIQVASYYNKVNQSDLFN